MREQHRFCSLLRSFSQERSLARIKRLHEILRENGYDRDDTMLGNVLVQAYGNCGNIEESRFVFGRIRHRNIFSWTILLVANAQNRHLEDARLVFDRMPQRNLIASNAILAAFWKSGDFESAEVMFEKMETKNTVTSNTMLTAYAQNRHLDKAQKFFDLILDRDAFSWSILVNAFAQCGYMDHAKNIFDLSPQRDSSLWNAVIAGYSRNGDSASALATFHAMDLQPDQITFVSAIDACSTVEELEEVREKLASFDFRRAVYVGNALIATYGKCGQSICARDVFDQMPARDVQTWNTILATYAQAGHMRNAQDTFERMPSRDVVTFNSMVAAFSQDRNLSKAKETFDECPCVNLQSWNALLAGFVNNELAKQAITLFVSMDCEGLQPNKLTFLAALDAAAMLCSLSLSEKLHEEATVLGFESDVFIATSLVTLYGRCGNVAKAAAVFETMRSRNLVSWNAMLAAYAHNGHCRKAIGLLKTMDVSGVRPDNVTFVSVADACSGLGSLATSRLVHKTMTESVIDKTNDVTLCNSLVNMYAKCGSARDAWRVFTAMPKRNAVTWNSIVAAFAQNDRPREAIHLFNLMCLEGGAPNEVTLLSVLAACSHAGMVGRGWSFFHSMRDDFGVAPKMEHYACLADQLGRAGHLKDAQGIIDIMPYEPHSNARVALLMCV
ncbi:pentatricopeptide repeat-containing protein At3g09040, mitochondrial-like [Selaginella moellendorffii]|uniref:pentatricopeptide repeat-containing protein At3g09040, mitochondrial-like n=1 Tax=Selaginella moellendorffii TaxID=88036 RepID=UPI000D1C786D|nr:pentatricopeptide repeat-containing protein At3g09040, mitochondrial-like [Selaginella moellendorffii]|eukprot:XP_024544883.1 pentatricopeptide repeat-containing protein At3g09040, mitochondrial-like [Selaginella moellendorffii]